MDNTKQPRLHNTRSSPRETFIVRLWQRDVAATESLPADWLGQVQHVHSGKTAVVHNLDELTAVVKQLIALSPKTTTLK